MSVRTAHRPCASQPPRMTLYICSRHAPMSTLAFLSCIALAEHTVAAGRGTPAGLWDSGVREREGAVSTNASSFAGEAADQRTAQQAQRGQVGAAEPRARRQPGQQLNHELGDNQGDGRRRSPSSTASRSPRDHGRAGTRRAIQTRNRMIAAGIIRQTSHARATRPFARPFSRPPVRRATPRPRAAARRAAKAI